MGELTFRKYQREAAKTDLTPGNSLESMLVPLLGLAGETGSLLSEYKKWMREGDSYTPFTDQVSEEIGDILWYLSNVAEKAGLDFQDVAEENLAKLQDRWASGNASKSTLFLNRYDEHYPMEEQLPRKMRIEFSGVEVDGIPHLKISCNGKQFGDSLTDNSHINDGYRFHDVFHFGCAVLIGWSPIIRKLLKVKRKSVPRTDEVEDGARAAAIEEAISAFTFGIAQDYSLFRECKTVDYSILRTIRIMTRSLEVRDRPLRDWENVILKSYSVWRMLIENGGGTVIGDANSGTFQYHHAL